MTDIMVCLESRSINTIYLKFEMKYMELVAIMYRQITALHPSIYPSISKPIF